MKTKTLVILFLLGATLFAGTVFTMSMRNKQAVYSGQALRGKRSVGKQVASTRVDLNSGF